MQHQTFRSFYSRARDLRAVFDERFADPLQVRGDRFIWDYWHVPGEYTLLKTPAPNFFPSKMYGNFHRYLVEWGRANLGCHDISPPWLSCYIEGCRQEKHADIPHGPLAFVYSLTEWDRRRKFRGGETFIEGGAKPIPARFNQLLVFNGAIPHGVREVRGTHDPRYGRLVIHGWFVNPRPFWYGPLKVGDISRGIEDGLDEALSGQLRLGRGMISTRLAIRADGSVGATKTLVNTLVDFDSRDLKRLQKALKTMRFPKRRAGTALTLPLIVE